MKVLSLLTLIIAATSINTDAAPVKKSAITVSLAQNPSPDYYTWRQSLKIHENRAVLKYATNIKKAYQLGLLKENPKKLLAKATEPVFKKNGTSSAAAATGGVATDPL